MNLFKGMTIAALVLVLATPTFAAPPENPGQKRNDRANNNRGATERIKERLGQTRSTERGLSADRGRPENAGRPADRGRPEKAGRPEGETRGSARSALVNKGQNKLARINADKILAKRLAQVERLRDVALNNGDEELLAKADELEQLARDDYTRRTGESLEPADPGTGEPMEPTEPTEPTAPTQPTEPSEPMELTEPVTE